MTIILVKTKNLTSHIAARAVRPGGVLRRPDGRGTHGELDPHCGDHHTRRVAFLDGAPGDGAQAAAPGREMGGLRGATQPFSREVPAAVHAAKLRSPDWPISHPVVGNYLRRDSPGFSTPIPIRT